VTALDQIPVCVPPRKRPDVVVTVCPPHRNLFEKEWTHAETARVLQAYDQGVSIYELEAICGIELEQIVTRLIRLIFGMQGDLGDESAAVNSGESYTAQDLVLMRDVYENGGSLAVIATTLGRTPLGAGWKMLALGIPTISTALRDEYLTP
jgi:hypothetical protein